MCRKSLKVVELGSQYFSIGMIVCIIIKHQKKKFLVVWIMTEKQGDKIPELTRKSGSSLDYIKRNIESLDPGKKGNTITVRTHFRQHTAIPPNRSINLSINQKN